MISQPVQAAQKPRELLERLLLHNVLPFWQARAVDTGHGGYYVNHDARGRPCGSADKHLVAQARTLWFFARLARSPYGNDAHLAAAQHGYEFLVNRMWDRDHGGFYWCVSSSEQQAISPDKHLYGQAFALFALSEYAAAASDSTALDFAASFFRLLDARALDAEHGGYRECLARDWSQLAVERGHLGHAPEIKSTNTHIHLLEAMMRFAAVSGDRLANQRLHELCELFTAKIVCFEGALGAYVVERHAHDWHPFNAVEDRRASYGHDVETAWLLSAANAALSEPKLLDTGRALFHHALCFGFDRVNGGFYESGPFGEQADRRAKLWWVQAEGMLGALRMFETHGDSEYADCFLKTLGWVVEHQADWKYGEWHPNVDERNRPSGNKAGPWKSPYHVGRALLECLDRLGHGDESPRPHD